jgi:RimJ/RimL family protein N-acetyltransferase
VVTKGKVYIDFMVISFMNRITFRKADIEKDLAKIASLAVAAEAERSRSQGENWGETPVEFMERRLTSKSSNGMDYFIAEDGDEIVGYIEGGRSKDEADSYSSHYLYVSSGRRRQGIGFRLKQAQIGHARSAGCRTVKTRVMSWNETSLAFQRKLGAVIKDESCWYESTVNL